MNLKLNIFLKYFLFMSLINGFLWADISGMVFRDYNLNGIKDSSDTGISDVEILAYCEGVSTPIVTRTDINGTYVISGNSSGKKCRIEANVETAGMGAGSNAGGLVSPLVDIVQDGATHDISAASPASYCQDNPDVVTVGMPGGANLISDTHGTLFRTALPQEGTFNGQDTIDTERTVLGTHSQTGAIWGLAWKKSSKELFAASNLRRYVPLKGDAGAIYKIDTQNNNSISLLVTVPNVVSDTVQNTVIPNRTYGENEDIEIGVYTGREGLGDLDISEDETKLYTVNMYKKELVTIDSVSGNILSNVIIPNPYGSAVCPDVDVRPWALKVRGSKVYIGSVCDSKIEDGVGAIVQEYTGTDFTTIAQTNTLRYLKPLTYSPNTPSTEEVQYHNWDSWSEVNKYRVPMFTDMEFDNHGNLVLGYTDRISFIDNSQNNASGDIRKMCLESDGTFTDESTAAAPTSCEVTPTQYPDNDEKYYEFYIGDYYFYDGDAGRTNADGHPETASGALAQAPGIDSIIAGMVDGTDWNEPGAIGLFSHTTGDKIGAQAIVKNTEPEQSAYFGKGGGLGDVELLCDPAPIEVGNYVWQDSNGDGIQDADEPALALVPVKLYQGTTLVGTVITDSSGHYYFGGNANVGMNPGEVLLQNTNYTLKISTSDVNGNNPTLADTDNNSNDIRDNDAILELSDAVINFNTTVINNHSFDFGFSSVKVSIGSFIWEDLNGDGLQDDVENGIADVNVTLLDENGTVITNVDMLTTNADGQYYFSGLEEGTYSILVSPPTGYVACKQQNDTNDSEIANDSNIASSNGDTYQSGFFTLSIANEVIETDLDPLGKAGTDDNDSLEDTNGNMTVDFCFYKPASLGDYVWYDDDKDGKQNEATTRGVENVTVTLLKNCDATQVEANTTTDASGKYLFEGLYAGDYCVEFSNLPVGYTPTSKGGVGTEDSDVSTIVPYKTDLTTLGVGENDLSWDMGIKKSCSLKINDDEVNASTEGPVTTINILDNDLVGIEDNNTIKFLDVNEEMSYDADGKPVLGAGVELSDSLVVQGEGIWNILPNGTVTFTAEDGFTGVPTPVNYIILSDGAVNSNVAQIIIRSQCVCEPYEENSIASFNIYAMLALILMSMNLTFFFFRKEFE